MKANEIDTLDWSKGNGLLPAIAQHSRSGRVLMLGYVNRDALARCFESGFAVFFSRSRSKLWQKGETSGNTLKIRSIDTDCDRDTILLGVDPAGPTCHQDTDSCFAAAMPFLDKLDSLVASRLHDRPDGSYTATLAAGGIAAGAQKLGEEAVELAIAAVSESDNRVTSEAADLLFHLIVVLRQRGLSIDDAVQELERRNTDPKQIAPDTVRQVVEHR